MSIFHDENTAASYLVDAEYHQPELQSCNKKLIWNCFGNIIVDNIKKNLQSDKPLRVRRDQYITKNSKAHKDIVAAVEAAAKEAKKKKEAVKHVQIDITDKELDWIDNQHYRKNSPTDRLLLFILLYLQKRYGKDGCFKIKSNVKEGIRANLIDNWIGSDICKKGLTRLENMQLITVEDVSNRFGKYKNVHVNIPDFESSNTLFSISTGNPLIPLYEYTGERVIKKCVVCGEKYIVSGNTKTCRKLLCKNKLKKETKDKCNKKAV